MESNKEAETPTNLIEQRLKSINRYSRKCPNQVEATVLKETYNDLVNVQQMKCNELSPQESAISISTIHSSNILKNEQFAISTHILANIETTEDVNTYEKTEFKISISNDVVKEKVNIDQKDSDKSIEDYTIEQLTNSKKCNIINQQNIILYSTHYGRKFKQNKSSSRKFRNLKHSINKHTKSRITRNTISNYLEKISDKSPQSLPNSVTKIVSRQVEIDLCDPNILTSTENEFYNNEDDKRHMYPQEYAAKKDSFISNTSGNTLTYESSFSSNNEDIYSCGTVKSFIEIAPEITTSLYRTDVVSISKDEIKELSVCNKEKFIHLEQLTCKETINKDMLELPFQITSGMIEFDFPKLNTNLMSDATLVNIKSNVEVSSDESFDLSPTISELNHLNQTSALTLQKNMSVADDIENVNTKKSTLLQTVINLSCYSEITPSTSSAAALIIGLNDVIVTKHDNKNYLLKTKDKPDDQIQHACGENVLKKAFDIPKNSVNIKNFGLPNQTHINEILNDHNNISTQRKCADEAKGNPYVPEIWDRVTVYIDGALKRLEESVIDKIIKELKKSVCNRDSTQPMLELKADKDIEKGHLTSAEPLQLSSKLTSVRDINKQTDECVQCDIVQNNYIDQIMSKLVKEGPNIVEPGSLAEPLLKLKEPQLLKDYLEVLKPPTAVAPQAVVDKAVTVTMSTTIEEMNTLGKIKMLLLYPFHLVRENVFVITSVPMFFVILMFVYGILVLLMKPW